MPLYEYQCESCGSVFEKIQKFSDSPITEHENCGGHVHKRMTTPSFKFKGTGWYITDYGRGGKKQAVEGNGGSKANGEGKGDSTKSDSAKGDSSKTSSAESSKSDSSASKSESSSPATTTGSKTSEK